MVEKYIETMQDAVVRLVEVSLPEDRVIEYEDVRLLSDRVLWYLQGYMDLSIATFENYDDILAVGHEAQRIRAVLRLFRKDIYYHEIPGDVIAGIRNDEY